MSGHTDAISVRIKCNKIPEKKERGGKEREKGMKKEKGKERERERKQEKVL